jgi:transposase
MKRTLTRKLARVKPGTLFVGVDLALDHNVAVILDGHAQHLARFHFPNDRGGFDFFRCRLTSIQQEQQAPAVLVGVEPPNYYWKLLVTYLEHHQIPYCLVNAYTVKKHREGDQLDRSKDDQRDAFVIGDLVRTGKYTETRLLHSDYAELRQYVVLFDRLRADIRRQKVLLRNTAGQLFPELSTCFKDFTGETALALLRNHAVADTVQGLELTDFITRVRTDFHGERLCVSLLHKVHRLAATSVGLKDGTQALQMELRVHIDTLTILQDQLQRVKTDLINTFLATPEARYLMSVPKLGTITAAFILAEIGNPNNFSNAQQLIKLAGTQPVPNSSGRKSRSKTPMSKKGRPRLRKALFFAVLRLIKVDDTFARQYQRLLQREKNPLNKMQALGVLMNKLLRVLWALMSQKTFYDPAF